MERNSGEDERDRSEQGAEEAGTAGEAERAEQAETAERADRAGRPAEQAEQPAEQPPRQDAAGDGSARDSGDADAPLPLDEKAAWEQIVASYGDAPKAEDLAPARPEGERDTDDERGSPVRSLTVYPAIGGPRDWSLAEDEPDAADGEESDDEGHFEPPEPPPLPEADTTSKFAWLAVLGGPLLLLVTVLLQFELTWWIGTLGVGGFLGGFATLVARMRDGRDEDDWEDPGRGAVV